LETQVKRQVVRLLHWTACLALAAAALAVFAADADLERRALQPAPGRILLQPPQVVEPLSRPEPLRPEIRERARVPAAVAVPPLHGKTLHDAEMLLRRSRLKPGKISRKESDAPVDTVISQQPGPGTRVAAFSAVDLVVSKAAGKVPDVVGKKLSAAQKTVSGSGYRVVVTRQQMAEGREDIVIRQEPRGGEPLAAGGSVTLTVPETPADRPLTVSISPARTVTVMQGDEEGVTYTAVANRPGVSLSWNGAGQGGSGDKFTVKTAALAPGRYSIAVTAKANRNARIARSVRHADAARAQAALVVKARDVYVTVPRVIDDDLREALSKIEQRKLAVGNIERIVVTTGVDNRVVGQEPRGGTRVEAGSRVNLEVADLKPAPLHVEIRPARTAVVQGAVAEFFAEFAADDMRLSWRGPGQQGEGGGFRVETSMLEPGEYRITLSARDRSRRSAEDSALLVVVPRPPEFVVVPPLVGMHLDDALEALGAHELVSGGRSFRRVTAGEDHAVLEQQPAAGTEVAPGSRVNLVVSELQAPPLKVFIEPPEAVVEQGERVHFELVSEPPGAQFRWNCAGKEGQGNWVEIETGDLEPSEYRINVIAVKQVGEALREGQQSAWLVVQPSGQQPPGETPAEKFSLRLASGSTNYRVNDQAVFRITPSAAMHGVLYSLAFEDGTRSAWSPQLERPHRFLHSGEHRVQAQARINGKVFSSNFLDIWVWPRWLPGLLGGLGLLAVGSGIGRALRGERAAREPLMLTCSTWIDPGTAEVAAVKLSAASEDLAVRFDYGLPGVQQVDIFDDAASAGVHGGEKDHE
jgi:beta-lactam-binding protein with PASTA domain